MSTKTLSELLIEAENAKKELNAAIFSDSISQVEKSKKALDKAIKDYNELAIILDYQTLRASSTPMLSAIEQLAIATIEAKQNKDKETGTITYSIDPSSKQISLVAFDEFCQREKIVITPDPLWKHKVDRFCLLVTYRIMKELGQDTRKLEDTYYISETAKQIDLGRTPVSNTQMLKQLQSIVDSIIYEADGDKNAYKVTSHDVAYVIQTMTRRGREAGTVISPRSSTMQMLVMDILHRIVTDGDFKVEYVTKKQAKKADENMSTGKSISTEIIDAWIIDGIEYNKTYFPTLADAQIEHNETFKK